MKLPALAGMLLCVFLYKAPGARAAESGPFFSTAYLAALCDSDENGKEKVKGGHNACQSYISGVIDYHHFLRSVGTAPSIDFCVPNWVNMRDLQETVSHYLKKNTQHNAFIASPAVALAIYDRFPCKKSSSRGKRR